jgi:hypothetical protein
MSNFLAIAAVTETLRQMLEASVSAVVGGARATAVRPTASGAAGAGGLPNVGVNVFLYQVSSNAAWRNMDLPTHREDGSLANRPRAALDLYYLLTFYGQDNQFEPQRLLGRTVQTLHAHAVLSRPQIRSAVGPVDLLANSDLADQVELVKFTPVPLTLEELSKLWSVFFQTAYVLSVAYQAAVVLIEGDESPRPSLPVRERHLRVLPFQRPAIEEISPQILGPGETLTILGRNLKADPVQVRFRDAVAVPAVVTDERLDVVLPPGLPAGVNTAQVVHLLDFGTGGASDSRRIFESNVAAFVLAPRIRIGEPPGPEPVFSSVPRDADFTLEVAPPVGRAQEVRLLLGNRTIALPPQPADAPPTTTALTFRIPRDFPTGEFLVRVQVDGAQSRLTSDAALDYVGPRVRITCAGQCLRCTSIALNPIPTGMEGLITVQDETAAPMAATEVSVTWTLPGGTTQEDTRRTDNVGVATFRCLGGAGEYVLTIDDLTKDEFEFDQSGSVLSRRQSK